LEAINLLESIVVKEESFEKSRLTNNYAENNGGAIYALGGLRVSDTIFGVKPAVNPNYNPERRFLNPEYLPESSIPNPLFGNGELPRIPNELHNPDVPSTVPNPSCDGANQFFENGYTGESFCVVNGIYYSTSIENPDQRWIVDFPNPLYSDQPSIYIPAVGEEFIYILDHDGEEDPYKYDYLGNSSGNDGGAIYVLGATTVKGSEFNGNLSDDDGGAIYSEGALEIKDSSFNRNWADDDGGAIRTSPEDGDLFITRTAFIENVAIDDGGAIDISTGPVAHYDDVILSSLFRGNEAFGSGGAIDSAFVVLILNTFEDNTDPQGATLDIGGGALSGNVLIGSSNEGDLCSIYDFVEAADNFATDSSCFESGQSELNTLLTREEITSEEELHILSDEYGVSILQAFQSQEEFFLDSPSDSNPEGVLAPLGDFITQELNKDFESQVRESTLSWTAGHLQRILPEPPVAPEVDNSVVDKEKEKPKDSESNSQGQSSENNNQVVITPPSSNDAEAPVLILDRVLSSEELVRIAQQRAEQLAAELKRQQEAERAAAERLAKIKADKLARDKARALAAEKRRAQLAALKAKIAATQARGEMLKQKNSWINLMKDFPNSATQKKLVKVPTK
jgi:predicted outer membrane repeat protein